MGITVTIDHVKVRFVIIWLDYNSLK